MNSHDKDTSGYVEKRALLLLLVGVTLALGYILWPFFGAILWGVIVALLFSPLYRKLLQRLRHWPTAAALVTLVVVLVIVIFPLILVTASLGREAASVYQKLQSEEWKPALYFHGVFDALPAWISALLGQFDLANFDVLLRRLTAALAQGSQVVATQAFSIGQNTFEFIGSLFITLYLAFFLIRDGDHVVLVLRRAVPLAPAHKKELFDKFTTVIRATVKGNLLVAAIQGSLGGLAFWFLGVSGAMLWAVMMAFASLLPAIGAGLVWGPVALYFLLNGAIWQGTSLVAYGVFVIGSMDNILRPVLVGKDARLPDYIVMITTVGGMAVFGINGFVIGPAIAAMFFSVWHIYMTTRVDMNA